MTTTMGEGDAGRNKEALAALAELLREEVERRFALEGDYAERERVMHEVGNEVLRLVQEQDLQAIADRFDTGRRWSTRARSTGGTRRRARRTTG